jgi:type III secretory pathway component EscS
MKFVGILLALVGWLIPLVGLTMTQSMTARFLLALLGIAVTLFAIMGILNRAHLKTAIWKL